MSRRCCRTQDPMASGSPRVGLEARGLYSGSWRSIPVSIDKPATLLVLTVLVCGVWLLSWLSGGSSQRTTANTTVANADPAQEPAVDDEGRWIVALGEIELRVPKERRSQPPAPMIYDTYPEALCMQEHAELKDCFNTRDRIQISLGSRQLDFPMPECNIDKDFRGKLLNGPLTTAHAEVELYKSDSGTTRKYVYRMAGETCRLPTARCGATNCATLFTPRPGVTIRYAFDEDFIDDWPAIHRRVFEHTSVLFAGQEDP